MEKIGPPNTGKILPFVRKPQPEPKPPANLLEQLERQLFQDENP